MYFSPAPQITELSGYAHRVSEMLIVFEDVRNGRYQRNTPRPKSRKDSIDGAETALLAHGPQVGQVVDLSELSGGEVVDTESSIVLKNVPIITPTGDIVVSSLSFEVYIIVSSTICN